MLKPIPPRDYDKHCERLLNAYEEAGLTPVQCMSDITDLKAKYASDDGYADGCICGGIALILAGIICKCLAKKELRQMNDDVRARLRYAMSVKPLTDFKVPDGTDDRDENN